MDLPAQRRITGAAIVFNFDHRAALFFYHKQEGSPEGHGHSMRRSNSVLNTSLADARGNIILQ
jgi:hypothetical protein